MKLFCLLLLITGGAWAQAPTYRIRRDTLPTVFPPDVMPNARPNNSFYRNPADPQNVMRATLDNMPIKVPDSSMQYTILRAYQKPLRSEAPVPMIKPLPRIIPKKF